MDLITCKLCGRLFSAARERYVLPVLMKWTACIRRYGSICGTIRRNPSISNGFPRIWVLTYVTFRLSWNLDISIVVYRENSRLRMKSNENSFSSVSFRHP